MEPKELPKQFDLKVFLRRIKRYQFILYIVVILVLVFLIPRFESIVSKIDFLNIKTVSVQTIEGEKPEFVSENEVTEVVEKYIGENYFTFPADPLRAGLLKKSAFIKEAIISKRFPNSIDIDIVEREPFLIAVIDEASCILLDASAYTLIVSEESEDENCAVLKDEYSVPVLTLEDSKIVFKENQQSSFYVVEDIWRVTKVLNEYGYQVISLKLDDQILIVSANDKRTITFSLNQSIDTQLERFIAVVGQIQLDDLDFKTLDLRYKRPVLKRK